MELDQKISYKDVPAVNIDYSQKVMMNEDQKLR